MKTLIKISIIALLSFTCTSFSTSNKITVEQMKTEIKNQGILHPEIVLRQSIWESGWFKCTSCSWRYKNPFGFRHKMWITESNPKGYRKYDTWQESVAYYKRWQAKFYKGGNYYKFLEEIGYAEAGNYTDNLKKINL